MLNEHKIFLLTAHILGTVFGLGGASIADLLFFRFLRDYKISSKESDILSFLKNIILSALLLIIVSGIGLFMTDIEKYSNSGPFLVKMIIVSIVTINGFALHIVVAPHLLRLNFHHHKKRYQRWRKIAFMLGGISVCSWYSSFLIAMLKSKLTQSFTILFGGYLVILIITIILSQFIEQRIVLRKK